MQTRGSDIAARRVCRAHLIQKPKLVSQSNKIAQKKDRKRGSCSSSINHRNMAALASIRP